MTRTQWQIDQGTKCSCRGTDEYCPCQNSRPIKTAAPGIGGADEPQANAGVGELVEALKLAMDGMEASGGWEGDEEVFKAVASAIRKGEAALAKYATQQGAGGQPVSNPYRFDATQQPPVSTEGGDRMGGREEPCAGTLG